MIRNMKPIHNAAVFARTAVTLGVVLLACACASPLKDTDGVNAQNIATQAVSPVPHPNTEIEGGEGSRAGQAVERLRTGETGT